MKLLLTIAIALLVGIGIWYFVLQNQDGMQMQINSAQNDAQEKTDAYRKQQEEMMKQLDQ